MANELEVLTHLLKVKEALKESFRWRDEAERLQKAFRIDYPTEGQQNSRLAKAQRDKVQQLYKRAISARNTAMVAHRYYVTEVVYKIPFLQRPKGHPMSLAPVEALAKKEYDNEKKQQS